MSDQLGARFFFEHVDAINAPACGRSPGGVGPGVTVVDDQARVNHPALFALP
ncbi:hypothetical protein [Actinosynnema sp. ALI-1.44]|uniref:hypothetical protein n=1 Tax=Actinosynnema sp. ALI-1.44 TaxID=1933779 RepID=UPI00143D7632|nr:hypothetical protein [Actinosynnema sp. ALI-1.44]